MYAVVDVETTGLVPKLKHRVAEIAVVLVDDRGQVESEWSTLVNPDRDLGPQHIHGIMARDVVYAPRFEDIAGHVVSLLTGRALVAHNLAFDMMFLQAEFERVSVALPVTHNDGICTMRLGSRFLPGAARGLADCCAAADIDPSPRREG